MHRIFLPAVVLVLLSPPPAAAERNKFIRPLSPDKSGRHHFCLGHRGKYRPNSAFDASLRRLEATLPAAVASSPRLSVQTTVGGPVARGVVGFSFCRAGMSRTTCGACVARAFRDAQRWCPYMRDAAVDYGPGDASCVLHYYDAEPNLPLSRERTLIDWS
ncbi:hypothetical protein ACP70R_004469 [Stipagrostis hirtigluma subsp. patula]